MGRPSAPPAGHLCIRGRGACIRSRWWRPRQRAGLQGPGLEVCPAQSADEAREIIHRLAKENCAILYLTEQLAVQLQSELQRYKDALTPAIILIPGKEGSLGIGMANVKTAVERAVGADIL